MDMSTDTFFFHLFTFLELIMFLLFSHYFIFPLPPLTALLRQTNPNWRAMFILNSGSASGKFNKRMVTILQKYDDVRLKMVEGYMDVSC